MTPCPYWGRSTTTHARRSTALQAPARRHRNPSLSRRRAPRAARSRRRAGVAHHWAQAIEGLVERPAGHRQGSGTFVINRVEKNFSQLNRSRRHAARGRTRSVWLIARPALVTPEESLPSIQSGHAGIASRSLYATKSDALDYARARVRPAVPNQSIACTKLWNTPAAPCALHGCAHAVHS